MHLVFTKYVVNVKFILVPFIKTLFCSLISADMWQYEMLETFGRCFLTNAPEADTQVVFTQ